MTVLPPGGQRAPALTRSPTLAHARPTLTRSLLCARRCARRWVLRGAGAPAARDTQLGGLQGLVGGGPWGEAPQLEADGVWGRQGVSGSWG